MDTGYKIMKSKNLIQKIYKRKELVSPLHILKHRWRLIEYFSISLPCFIETKVDYNEDYVWIKQYRIKKKPINSISKYQRLKLLKELAADLDIMCREGFVHGDINRKNIAYDTEKLLLIDLEPDLVQIKNGKRTFFSTTPYIASSDLRNGKITTATDKISFACFCKIWGKGYSRPLNSKELVRMRLKKDVPILTGVSDLDIVSKTFVDIVDFC